MAKGKQASGKKYVSKGERRPNRSISKAVRREYVGSLVEDLNKIELWAKGKVVKISTLQDGKMARVPLQEKIGNWAPLKIF
jgi:hypothetical protein